LLKDKKRAFCAPQAQITGFTADKKSPFSGTASQKKKFTFFSYTLHNIEEKKIGLLLSTSVEA
jgi:hypothetical protein